MKSRQIFQMFLLFTVLFLISCKERVVDNSGTTAVDQRLKVVTTLFPLYDFTRTIGGDRVDLILLLPPGVEPHSFEPRPEDAVKSANADLFIYTSKQMEPWVAKFVQGFESGKVLLVDSSQKVQIMLAEDHAGRWGKRDRHLADPHIWLDPVNAKQMVANITDALVSVDPLHGDIYRKNSDTMQKRLSELDQEYQKGLANCKTRLILHGGHYTFGYLSSRYGLDYRSAVSVSADAEPSPTGMVALINQTRKSGVRYIFTEEAVSPRLAEAIAEEAAVDLLTLHNLHNLSKEELKNGADYFVLMRRNLAQLQKGLECK